MGKWLLFKGKEINYWVKRRKKLAFSISIFHFSPDLRKSPPPPFLQIYTLALYFGGHSLFMDFIDEQFDSFLGFRDMLETE